MKQDMLFFEVSACSGEGIETLAKALAAVHGGQKLTQPLEEPHEGSASSEQPSKTSESSQ